MKKYLYLMRVHHYIKNILIFMPLIFSGNLTDRRKFTATLLGMIAFSLVTSAVYIINDISHSFNSCFHNNLPLIIHFTNIKMLLLKRFIISIIVFLIITTCHIVHPYLII